MKYELIQDQDCECPLDKDDPVKITHAATARTVLGTESVTSARAELLALEAKRGTIIALPVWAYVHSGTALKAAWENPFSCPWDSGQSGIVYIGKKGALKEYGWKRMSPSRTDIIHERLKATVEEFGQWLNGECYGFVIKDDYNNERDSCWGFIGREYAEKCAKEAMAELEAAQT